jgi:hypothetical protein
MQHHHNRRQRAPVLHRHQLSVALALSLCACQRKPAETHVARAEFASTTARTPSSPAQESRLTLEYFVELTEDHERLQIEAQFPRGTPAVWWVDPPAMPYVDALEVKLPDGKEGSFLSASGQTRGACARSGCRLRYTFHLRKAAQQIANRLVASEFSDSILAPPSTWLLRPRTGAAGFQLVNPRGFRRPLS